MWRLKRIRLLPEGEAWTEYVWLIYMTYFAVYPFAAHKPAWQIAAGVAGTLAALVMYFAGYWLSGKRALWIVAGFLLLATVFVRINPGATVFYVYGACFLAGLGDASLAYRYLGGILVLIALEAWLLRLSPSAWISAMVLSALIGSVVIHYDQETRLTQKLLVAQEQAEHMAKVAERERIARDLHDLLGHTLSLIILKSELASRLAEREPARAVQEIREVETISREALAQVRAAVRGYRSAGFENELREARKALETAGIQVETSMQSGGLSAAQESVFAMALREAVTNIVRHAHASVCRLALRRDGRFCELEIADNGRGGAFQEGSGLAGMRERVEALGGVLERDASSGTRLRIKVPV
jgi:two-component system sensor histidine kinase DesK